MSIPTEPTGSIPDLRRAEEEWREQTEWLWVMLGRIGDAVISTDTTGRVTFMNDVAESLTGWAQAEALGQPLPEIFRLVNGQSREPVENPALRALKEGALVRPANHSLLIAKDNTERPIDDSAAPIRSPGGELLGAVLIFREISFYDITERKRAEEARARLAAIVDSSDDAIVSKTLDGIVTTWNAGAQRLLGYRPEEIIGQSITRIIPPDRQSEEVEIQQRLRRNERVEHYETVRVAKDGRRVEVSLSISPIHDDAGRIIGASKIARDITERKQAEKALQRAQAELVGRADQLEQAVAERTAELTATNEQLEAFVYSIAHDLRAPLRSMTGLSQLLLQDHAAGLNEVAQNFLKRIQTASEFMDVMLLDLLSYGSTSRFEIALKPVEIAQAWKAALFQTAAQAEQTGAQIELQEPLPVVGAHEAMLGQCLANLLSNAMKFVPPGTRPHIRVWAEEIPPPAAGEAPRIRLWMEDNGIGIPAEHQERAFRIFERLHGSRYPGTGIGLSIVRKGIERMGGRVGLESTPGRGTRFWLELIKG